MTKLEKAVRRCRWCNRVLDAGHQGELCSRDCERQSGEFTAHTQRGDYQGLAGPKVEG